MTYNQYFAVWKLVRERWPKTTIRTDHQVEALWQQATHLSNYIATAKAVTGVMAMLEVQGTTPAPIDLHRALLTCCPRQPRVVVEMVDGQLVERPQDPLVHDPDVARRGMALVRAALRDAGIPSKSTDSPSETSKPETEVQTPQIVQTPQNA
jgi:hypothetical protein